MLINSLLMMNGVLHQIKKLWRTLMVELTTSLILLTLSLIWVTRNLNERK